MYLTILLLTSIFTICAIFLLNIQKESDQIKTFIVTHVFFILFCMLCYSIMNGKQDNTVSEEKEMSEEEQNLKMIIEDKCKIPKKKVYTEDRILPLDTYNPSDCTNDNSCIIQPDKYNLSPGFKKIENKRKDCSKYMKDDDYKNKITKIRDYDLQDKTKCANCGDELSLLNNPSNESFEFRNPYDLSTDCNNFKINNLTTKQNVCIHCKQFSDFKF